jgi:hypothetical protein
MPILDVFLWVATQKSADLIYIAVKAWNYALPIELFACCYQPEVHPFLNPS